MLAVQWRVDEQLGQEQTGYRRGRQASEMIYCAIRVTQLSREWRQGFVMVKVDLEKAFDTFFSECCCWKEEEKGFRVGRDFLSHLIFVDDLRVIAKDPYQAREMMGQLRTALLQVGLKINGEKTEYIASMAVPEGLLEGVNATQERIRIPGRKVRPDNKTTLVRRLLIGFALRIRSLTPSAGL